MSKFEQHQKFIREFLQNVNITCCTALFSLPLLNTNQDPTSLKSSDSKINLHDHPEVGISTGRKIYCLNGLVAH